MSKKSAEREAIKTAERNFFKFHAWLEQKYPAQLPERVYATQEGDLLHISHVWSYGQLREEKRIATIPMYPTFDPNFEPETFYAP